MKISFTLLSTILFTLSKVINGQELLTETNTHIFWQEDRKLTIYDFQGEPGPIDIKYCKENGACVGACLGLFLKVDIPKNYRKSKLEKVYLAPAFEKTCSFVVSDSNDIRDGQLLFDVAEISSRIARKLLKEYHNYMAIESDTMNFYLIKENPDTILITGVGTSLAWHVKDSAWTFYEEMSKSYLSNMYSSSESEGFEAWRILVDEYLENLSMYATKPEDCYRMVKTKPIERNYKPAKQ